MPSSDFSKTPSEIPNSSQSSYRSIHNHSPLQSVHTDRSSPSKGDTLFWDNLYGPSRICQETLSNYHKEGLIPSTYRILLPAHSDRPNSPPPSCLTFWHAQFEAGLRLPIPKFLYQISNLYKVPLNQFVPNAIRMMISFYALIKGNGGKPTADLFFSQFSCKSSGPFFCVCSRVKGRCTFLGSVPNINKDWPNYYFFISSPSSWPLECCKWVYEPLTSCSFTPDLFSCESASDREVELLC